MRLPIVPVALVTLFFASVPANAEMPSASSHAAPALRTDTPAKSAAAPQKAPKVKAETGKPSTRGVPSKAESALHVAPSAPVESAEIPAVIRVPSQGASSTKVAADHAADHKEAAQLPRKDGPAPVMYPLREAVGRGETSSGRLAA